MVEALRQLQHDVTIILLKFELTILSPLSLARAKWLRTLTSAAFCRPASLQLEDAVQYTRRTNAAATIAGAKDWVARTTECTDSGEKKDKNRGRKLVRITWSNLCTDGTFHFMCQRVGHVWKRTVAHKHPLNDFEDKMFAFRVYCVSRTNLVLVRCSVFRGTEMQNIVHSRMDAPAVWPHVCVPVSPVTPGTAVNSYW